MDQFRRHLDNFLRGPTAYQARYQLNRFYYQLNNLFRTPSARKVGRQASLLKRNLRVNSWTVPLYIALLRFLFSINPTNPTVNHSILPELGGPYGKMINLVSNLILTATSFFNTYLEMAALFLISIVDQITRVFPPFALIAVPINTLLRVRIHVAPRAGVIKSIMSPLCSDCHDFSGLIVLWFILTMAGDYFPGLGRLISKVRWRLKYFFRYLFRMRPIFAFKLLLFGNPNKSSSSASYSSSSGSYYGGSRGY